ncbi:hypothetical protein [Dactylosporangium sp. CA-233914]
MERDTLASAPTVDAALALAAAIGAMVIELPDLRRSSLPPS